MPRAVLVVSAHWYTAVTAVTAMARPRTIHDLFGFGPRLQTFQYPAPGSPEIAREIRDVVRPRFVGLDDDAWGLDHGTWSVMAHVFPAADVPVIQLSINGTKDFADHVDLGERLAPLRERGILIIGSGNVVHNLGRIDPAMRDGAFNASCTSSPSRSTPPAPRARRVQRLLHSPAPGARGAGARVKSRGRAARRG